MEARTGLVIGGVTAVAASIAVVTAVALANTMALTDSPGTSLASESVVVPSAASPSASPRATPSATTAPLPPADAEVVEAPAPLVVDPPSGSRDARSPVVPAAPPASETGPDASGPEGPADIEPVIAAAKASGSWDELRAWALAHGWTTARVDALVSRLARELTDKAQEERQKGEIAELPAPSPADRPQNGLVGSEADDDRKADGDRNTTSDRHSVPDSTSVGRERPAHAGSNVGNGNGADHDAKKDQSRDSPDKRD